MKCEQSREIILTEYLDGCLSDQRRKEWEQHLAACADCREYQRLAEKTVAGPFHNAPAQKMPGHVYDAIMQKVRAREERSFSGFWKRILAGIRDWQEVPVPVLRWGAAFAVCVLLLGVSIQGKNVEQARQAERVIFLAQVIIGDQQAEEPAEYYGTSMESYFL